MFKVTLLDTEYRVTFQHFPNEAGQLPGTRTEYKGHTVCRIWKGDEFILEGQSFCSKSDIFSKATGRRVALTDALSRVFNIGKEDRRRVWTTYLGVMSHG